MATKLAALIHFRDDVSEEEARLALERIEHVLNTPFEYDFDAGAPVETSVGDYVRSYDDEWGGPVWYIP